MTTDRPPTIIQEPATRPPIVIPAALEQIAAERRWVVWKLIWKTGKDGRSKPTKPPFRADNPDVHANTTDPSTWCDLKTAMLAYTEKQCEGIGFVLTDSDIAAFDIDDCRNDRTEAIHPWAQDLVRRSGSYVEVTPSGEGIRIIGRGSGEPVHRKISVPGTNGVSCELYRKASRYITVTGNQVIQCAAELANLDALLDETLAGLDGAQEEPGTGGVNAGARREHDLDNLIKGGCGEDFGGDRSRAVWYVINQLLRQRRSANDIVSLLLDRSNGISAHIYDQPHPEQYATKQIEKAQKERATDDDAELERLARLPPLEYGRERPGAAERLGGIPLHILDRAVRNKSAELGLSAAEDEKQGHAISFHEPEPWLEPVDGAELLDDITVALKRYVVMAEHEARACALWCIHTYLLDCFFISPRLAIRSATHRCGKTTLLDIVARLALRTLPSANVTAASVFRVVEACRPTVLIDEADTFLLERDELRGVINSGHRKGGAVIRTVGDDHEPRQFSTYAACAIAQIGKLPPTLHDRSAPVIDLKRRLRSEKVESFRLDRTVHLDVLARKAVRWAADHVEQIRNTDPELPAGVFNRDGDNWRPLLAIAEVAGGHWPEQAREAAAICCAVTGIEDASRLELLLGDIRDVFAAKKADANTSADEITSEALVEQLIKIEGHPWAEMGKSQKPLTQNRLARMLKPLGIATQKVGPEKRRLAGYTRDQFQEAFARYLPAEGASKADIRTECDEMGTSELFQSGQPVRGCPVEKCEKPNNDGLLSGCPVAKRGTEEKSAKPQPAPHEERPQTPRPSLTPRAIDHLAREFFELKVGSAEREDAIRSRLVKYVPAEAVHVEVEKVVRRIEALAGADDTAPADTPP